MCVCPAAIFSSTGMWIIRRYLDQICLWIRIDTISIASPLGDKIINEKGVKRLNAAILSPEPVVFSSMEPWMALLLHCGRKLKFSTIRGCFSHLMIQNFQQLEFEQFAPCKNIIGISWRVRIIPYYHHCKFSRLNHLFKS